MIGLLVATLIASGRCRRPGRRWYSDVGQGRPGNGNWKRWIDAACSEKERGCRKRIARRRAANRAARRARGAK